MSYHIIDCDVRNIERYMEEIVKVENSTQYMVSELFFVWLLIIVMILYDHLSFNILYCPWPSATINISLLCFIYINAYYNEQSHTYIRTL